MMEHLSFLQVQGQSGKPKEEELGSSTQLLCDSEQAIHSVWVCLLTPVSLLGQGQTELALTS